MEPKKSSALPVFSVRLGKLLADKGVTQQQVAGATGVAQSTISHYLRGSRAKPRIEEVLALAAYFSVPVEWMFGTDAPQDVQGLGVTLASDDARLSEMKTIVATIEQQVSALKNLLDGTKQKRTARKRTNTGASKLGS